MQIKIVRHDRGAKDADGDVKRFAIAKDFGARKEADSGFAPQRMSEKDFVGETRGDGGNQSDDKRFHEREAAALQRKDEENVESSDENAGKKGQADKQVQRDGGAQDLREVAGGDGDFADAPK